MRFSTTRLNDVRLIEMDPISDQRGFFARTFCAREFSEAGLATEYVQHSSLSHAPCRHCARYAFPAALRMRR